MTVHYLVDVTVNHCPIDDLEGGVTLCRLKSCTVPDVEHRESWEQRIVQSAAQPIRHPQHQLVRASSH
jgi:hypothetical protein